MRVGGFTHARVAGLAAALIAVSALVVSPTGSAAPERALPERTPQNLAIRAEDPIVFGHRGATGYRPEHTLASYELAAQLGAEYSIEADLVPTKDGVLVARHENDLSDTTDVAEHPEFADRRTTKTIDGADVTGWFTEDFTLAELKTLRVVERLPDVRQENTIYDGRSKVLTLQEIFDFAKQASRERSRPVGIVFETKHPTYFASIGLPLEEPLVDAIKRNGLNRPDGQVIIASFEPTSLRKLDDALRVLMHQNIAFSGAPFDTIARGEGPTYSDMVTPEGLREIATYSEWIGPDKRRVIPRMADGSLGEQTTLVRDAHAAGLKVAPWTFRNENRFLPTDMRTGDDPNDYGDAFAEYGAYYEAGIDGVWSDNPDTAIVARAEFLAR
jgi:glycerophosphoryl diester phosphodiesterase